MKGGPMKISHAQRGMALLVSLVFLLVLTLIGLSSMQSATLQEKMAGSVTLRNQSFQGAEAALRVGESAVKRGTYSSLPVCSGQCAPPAEALVITVAGFNSTSGVTWFASGNGFYGVQNISAVNVSSDVSSDVSATLYRVTAVGIAGNSRSVVESIYAK
ncbi:pilus assembly protein PilX [Pseudomonas frederiksbergensis]|uniref:Pilus assembly protein PilX n=2 Tax=Pseudomonas frederiksbergensis TaxID=104087 RepID=A0A423HXS3_9PSED|nr:pilus assembly protein PilX [Pseudomonas frederiksbergensis]